MKQKPSKPLFLLLASAGICILPSMGGWPPGVSTSLWRLGWCLEASGTGGFCVRHSRLLSPRGACGRTVFSGSHRDLCSAPPSGRVFHFFSLLLVPFSLFFTPPVTVTPLPPSLPHPQHPVLGFHSGRLLAFFPSLCWLFIMMKKARAFSSCRAQALECLGSVIMVLGLL